MMDAAHDHEAMRADMRTLLDANHGLADSLERIRESGWTDDKRRIMIDNLSNQNIRLTDIEVGFKGHFQQDEESFKPIMGDLMVDAIHVEHEEMIRRLSELRQLIAGATVKDIEPVIPQILEKTDNLVQFIETHIKLEADILRLIGKVFDARN